MFVVVCFLCMELGVGCKVCWTKVGLHLWLYYLFVPIIGDDKSKDRVHLGLGLDFLNLSIN